MAALPGQPHAGGPVEQAASRRRPQGLAGAPRWPRNESGAWSRPSAADGTSGHGRPPAGRVGRFRHPGKGLLRQKFTKCGVRVCLQVSMGGACMSQMLCDMHAKTCGTPTRLKTMQLRSDTRAVGGKDDSAQAYLLREDQTISLWSAQVQASSKPMLILPISSRNHSCTDSKCLMALQTIARATPFQVC